MSATNRGTERREGDYYPTPDELALRIVESVPLISDIKILEPSAGSGAFVRACREVWPGAHVTAVEPSSQHWPTLIGLGCTVGQHDLETYARTWGKPEFDLIIGNPPYSLALEHIRLCLDMLAPGGRLVFLLRLAFLETAKRREFFVKHPPSRVTVLSERPSFCWSWGCSKKRGGCGHKWMTAIGTKRKPCPKCGGTRLTKCSTDSAAYAVFEWTDGFAGKTALEWM